VFCGLCFIVFYLVQYFLSCIFTSIATQRTCRSNWKICSKARRRVSYPRVAIFWLPSLNDSKQNVLYKSFWRICWYSVARKKLLKNKWRCCRWKEEIWHKKKRYEIRTLDTNQKQSGILSIFIEGVQGSQYFRDLLFCREKRP
jgi:hypothetical protein